MRTRSKYGNHRTVVDGIMFDSQREAVRWCELKLLQDAGEITSLSRQVPFVLAEAVVINGRKKPALRYVADFCYYDKGKAVVEDVKGHKTDVYRIKQHLLKSVHGIDIKEV